MWLFEVDRLVTDWLRTWLVLPDWIVFIYCKRRLLSDCGEFDNWGALCCAVPTRHAPIDRLVTGIWQFSCDWPWPATGGSKWKYADFMLVKCMRAEHDQCRAISATYMHAYVERAHTDPQQWSRPPARWSMWDGAIYTLSLTLLNENWSWVL